MFESISFVSGHGLRTGLDDGGILGSILFVLQNSWHFWTVEEYLRIYFICTAKFLKILGRGGILGSILFVLPNSWHFQTVVRSISFGFFGNLLECFWNYFGILLEFSIFKVSWLFTLLKSADNKKVICIWKELSRFWGLGKEGRK